MIMEIRSFTPQEMDRLLGVDAPVDISLYLHINTATLTAKKARAGCLLRTAQERLEMHGWRGSAADMLLAPVRAWIDDTEIWRGRHGSIALFRAADEFSAYQVPFPLSERAVVGSQFFIKPLLPLLTWAQPFYVLAVSQHEVRLLNCSYDAWNEMSVEGMPRNLEEALRGEEVEKQHPVRMAEPAAGSGRPMAIRYGMGSPQDERKARVERYLRMIDSAVHHALQDTRAPLVFAGVEYLFGMYRQLTASEQLLSAPLKGNPDRMRAATLHERAREMLGAYFDEPKRAALARYRELEGLGRTFSDTESILHAAGQGRVESLFVNDAVEEWGGYDAQTGQVVLRPNLFADGAEMSNLAAILTLRHGGMAFVPGAGEMPSQTAMAAVLRY
jgi:hypothetical protein